MKWNDVVQVVVWLKNGLRYIFDYKIIVRGAVVVWLKNGLRYIYICRP